MIVCIPTPQNVCVTEGEKADVTVECDADQPLELEFILQVSVMDLTAGKCQRSDIVSVIQTTFVI